MTPLAATFVVLAFAFIVIGFAELATELQHLVRRIERLEGHRKHAERETHRAALADIVKHL